MVCSRDAGATWIPVPLVRTIWSSIRFWGFPVWPPEYIDTIGVERGLLRIGFRDDWVPFEPGGESLWTANLPSRRLWTVARIRLMDYDGLDVPGAPPAIDVELPPGFGLPSLRMLEVIASRVAADGPSRFADRYPWIWSIPVGVTAATSGPGWALLAALAATAVGVPVLSVLFERRRRRRQLSL